MPDIDRVLREERQLVKAQILDEMRWIENDYPLGYAFPKVVWQQRWDKLKSILKEEP